MYLADDRMDRLQVAVKESLAQNEIARKRFERERRVQQRLGGDHIVRVLGDDEFGSSRCLVLEYMAGGSLADPAIGQRRLRLSPTMRIDSAWT